MPRMEIRGMDAAIREMEQLSQRSQAAAQMAVQEAAKLLAQRLSAAAPVDTGALRSSIKPGPVTYDAASGYSCQVKPVGNHPATGEPLAKIGNILEYGRSYWRPVRPSCWPRCSKFLSGKAGAKRGGNLYARPIQPGGTGEPGARRGQKRDVHYV